MSQQTIDPSSKWMLEEHGASILYLAGARSVLSCKALKAEVVQPRKLPDGLLEARFAGSTKPSLVVVEVATYPEKRVVQQFQDDIRLVRQVHGVLPEALVLCLRPHGQYRVPERAEETSTLGWTGAALSWKVVEVWTLSAEELLAAPLVGIVPLVTLARTEWPPEVLLQRCRDRIEREGGNQIPILLAATQVFASLHYNKPEWLEILGGRKNMAEFPLIKKIVAETTRNAQMEMVLRFLEDRFGAVTPTVSAGLKQVKKEEKFVRLGKEAFTCPSLEAFEEALRQELPAPPQPSTRGKRRSRKT